MKEQHCYSSEPTKVIYAKLEMPTQADHLHGVTKDTIWEQFKTLIIAKFEPRHAIHNIINRIRSMSSSHIFSHSLINQSSSPLHIHFKMFSAIIIDMTAHPSIIQLTTWLDTALLSKHCRHTSSTPYKTFATNTTQTCLQPNPTHNPLSHELS